MKQKKNKIWPCVILHNGRPYLLKKLDRKGVNDPCSMCDLRQLCMSPSNLPMLYDLCTSDGRGDNYYYEEDWTIVDKQLVEFLMDPMYVQMLDDIQNVVKYETHKELEA